MSCNRGQLCDLLDKHSTEDDVRRLQLELQANYPRERAFQGYAALPSGTKWRKINYMLEVLAGRDDVCAACDAMIRIKPDDPGLRNGIEALCKGKNDSKAGGGDDESITTWSRDDWKRMVTLIVASLDFVFIFFAIIATFRWALDRPIAPMEFVILALVAVILALILYPFILVLLNIFSPEMAQEQFNRLHDFVESAFPSLLHWLEKFSHFFKSQQERG
jgi:hypothetical protein